MRSTITGSGPASVSGSASAPAWCAPAFRPWTGSWSEYIPCPPVSALRSTIDGGGGPSRAEEAGIELLPAGVRLLREADPVRVGIGDAEDARPPVARSAIVVERELLVHRHLGSAGA